MALLSSNGVWRTQRRFKSGGRSITDAAKIVALCLANNISDLDSLENLSRNLVSSIKNDVDFATSVDPPDVEPANVTMINIPTTLSAGKYSPYARGINPRDGVKKMFIHQSLYADVVILDPELTAKLLASLKAHEKQTEDAAEKGLVLVARWLLKLRKDLKDRQSRLDTQLGSHHAMDGLCRGIHLGGSHAIGHQLGTMNVAHGHTSGILYPIVMKFNASVNARRQRRAFDARWRRPLGRRLRRGRSLPPGSLTESSDLGDVLDGLFREDVMPRTLREVGVAGDDKLRKLAEQSLEDPWCRTNPITLTRAEQALEILRQVEG